MLLRCVMGLESTEQKQRKCGKKRRFASEKSARQAIAQLRRDRISAQDTFALQPYRCCHCGWFHFGNAPMVAKLRARRAFWEARTALRNARQLKWQGRFLLRECARSYDLFLLELVRRKAA